MKQIKLKTLIKENILAEDYDKTKTIIKRILAKYNVDPSDLANIFQLLEKHLK